MDLHQPRKCPPGVHELLIFEKDPKLMITA